MERIKELKNSLCTEPSPIPSVKIGEGTPCPIFTEGRGGSVHRLLKKGKFEIIYRKKVKVSAIEKSRIYFF